ncbi:MAG: alternative ribosome rescue aminoacyl-tRNA hydrolase ArfB [Phycisphaerae bacterium]|jgi:ribosome-associated protein
MTGRRLDSEALAAWIEWRYDRAEGPGGQNVNKVAARATLLFDFEACALLSAHERSRIRAKLGGRISRDGRLRIVAQQWRTQVANRRAAGERLAELIADALRPRVPRRPTRPTAGSRERRLRAKRQRGAVKQMRRRGGAGED